MIPFRIVVLLKMYEAKNACNSLLALKVSVWLQGWFNVQLLLIKMGYMDDNFMIFVLLISVGSAFDSSHLVNAFSECRSFVLVYCLPHPSLLCVCAHVVVVGALWGKQKAQHRRSNRNRVYSVSVDSSTLQKPPFLPKRQALIHL